LSLPLQKKKKIVTGLSTLTKSKIGGGGYPLPPCLVCVHALIQNTSKDTQGHSHCDICVNESLQHTATHCNTLQHTATHCNTQAHSHCDICVNESLQHTATHCNTQAHSYCDIGVMKLLQHIGALTITVKLVSKTLCNIPQHTATHRKELQFNATHCKTTRLIIHGNSQR